PSSRPASSRPASSPPSWRRPSSARPCVSSPSSSAPRPEPKASSSTSCQPSSLLLLSEFCNCYGLSVAGVAGKGEKHSDATNSSYPLDKSIGTCCLHCSHVSSFCKISTTVGTARYRTVATSHTG